MSPLGLCAEPRVHHTRHYQLVCNQQHRQNCKAAIQLNEHKRQNGEPQNAKCIKLSEEFRHYLEYVEERCRSDIRFYRFYFPPLVDATDFWILMARLLALQSLKRNKVMDGVRSDNIDTVRYDGFYGLN